MEILLESELYDVEGIESKILQPVKAANKKLKFIFHTDAVSSQSKFMKSLLMLTSNEDYRDLAMQFILINMKEMILDSQGKSSFSANPAVLATPKDMKALMLFLSQA